MIGIGSLFPLTFSYNTFQIYDIWIAKLSHDGSFKYKIFTVLCCCSSLHERRNDNQSYPRGETTATVVEKNDADNNL